jgi:hypothetical protein
MFRSVLVLSFLALVMGDGAAGARTFSAMRMARGGVALAGDGAGSSGADVACRAVPMAPGSDWALSLQTGFIPLDDRVESRTIEAIVLAGRKAF